MFAIDVCALPSTGGSIGVLTASLVMLVIGAIVTFSIRHSSTRLSIAIAPFLLLGGLATAETTEACPPSTTVFSSSTTIAPTTTAVTTTLAPTTAPSAPTSVSGTRGNEQVDITWLAPTNNGGSAITSYSVTASGIGSFGCTSATTSCTVTGLTNGTSYTFTVTAANGIGSSVASSPSGTSIPATVPDAPTLSLISSTATSANLEWTTPGSDGGSEIISYTVTTVLFSYDSGLHFRAPLVTCTTAATTRSCTVNNMTPMDDYHFSVIATNAVGDSVPSESVAAWATIFD